MSMKISNQIQIRDLGLYSGRNSSFGALLQETSQIFKILSSGVTITEVHDRALKGDIFKQKTWSSRKRVWCAIYNRYFTNGIGWIIKDLTKSYGFGEHSPEFLSMIYLHYSLSDRLAFDFVTKVVWKNWKNNRKKISRDDFLVFLNHASEDQDQINKWSPVTKGNLASNNLSAFRDFGLMVGKQKKEITQPPLPLNTVKHILRIIVLEGKRGKDILSDPTWRLFLRSPDDIADSLMKLSQSHLIRFERVGDIIVLETPDEWEKAE